MGARIITDQWRSYNRLAQHGRFHWNVNHAVTFVDPLTGYHTQDIESLWSRVKRAFRIHNGIPFNLLQEYLDEFTFRNNVKCNGISVWKAMLFVIAAIQHHVYFRILLKKNLKKVLF